MDGYSLTSSTRWTIVGIGSGNVFHLNFKPQINAMVRLLPGCTARNGESPVTRTWSGSPALTRNGKEQVCDNQPRQSPKPAVAIAQISPSRKKEG